MLSAHLKTIIVFLLFAVGTAAQEPPTYTVVSYYKPEAYLTERFIPFGVMNSHGLPAEGIESIEIPAPCHAMVDPHRAAIFHIYCTEETDVEFSVRVKDGGYRFKINLPAIHIKKLGLLSSTPAPASHTPGGGGSAISGQKLFNANCASCHPGTYPIPRNTSVSSLKSAFNEPTMTQFKNKFTDAELSALSKFINEDL